MSSSFNSASAERDSEKSEGLETKAASTGNTSGNVENASLFLQFCNVFTNEDLSTLPTLATKINSSISSIRISCQGVLKQLLQLKCDKAPGPDNIPPWILKMLAKELAPVLTDLFQSSLDQAILPIEWKTANIHGVFKSGKKE